MTEIESIADLKQYIQINAYDNKIELWKLEWGINSLEAGLREQIKVYERVVKSIDPNSGPESNFIIHRTFEKRIEELRRVLGGGGAE